MVDIHWWWQTAGHFLAGAVGGSISGAAITKFFSHKDKGDSLRACRREKFLNEESITYRHSMRRNLLILRSGKSISDRLLNCAIIYRVR